MLLGALLYLAEASKVVVLLLFFLKAKLGALHVRFMETCMTEAL